MASLGFLSFREHFFIYTKYSKRGVETLLQAPFLRSLTLVELPWPLHPLVCTAPAGNPHRDSHSIHERLADGEGVKRSVILDRYFL